MFAGEGGDVVEAVGSESHQESLFEELESAQKVHCLALLIVQLLVLVREVLVTCL